MLPDNLVYEIDKSNSLIKIDFYLVKFIIIFNKDNKGRYKLVLIYNYLPYNVIFADIFYFI